MTFLQRTTCYHNDEYAKLAVGWFSSGTGAAGLVGAALWWELRGLGVKTGISISSVSRFPSQLDMLSKKGEKGEKSVPRSEIVLPYCDNSGSPHLYGIGILPSPSQIKYLSLFISVKCIIYASLNERRDER